jgi:hypothetical protein
MSASVRHDIDDTGPTKRPHIRLCHLILRESMQAGLTTVAVTTPPGGVPTARALRDGSWTSFMAFPAQVYGMLVEHFEHMAGAAPDQPEAKATILVRLAGRDASVGLRVRRTDQGVDDLTLEFPPQPATQTAN